MALITLHIKNRVKKVSILLRKIEFHFLFGMMIIVCLYKLPVEAKSIQYIAHRGDMEKAPAGTLVAFEAAKKSGYNSFECDIVQTSSGLILVSHDINLKFLCGVDMNAVDINKSNIKKYPIVSGSNVHLYPTQYLPTLSQAVKIAKKKRPRSAISRTEVSKSLYNEQG